MAWELSGYRNTAEEAYFDEQNRVALGRLAARMMVERNREENFEFSTVPSSGLRIHMDRGQAEGGLMMRESFQADIGLFD